MSILDVIRSRRSVRTFDGKKLREEDAQKILSFAEQCGNPYQLSITWRLLDGEESGLSSPVILGSNTFLAGKMPLVPCAEEAFGYSFERIVLFAASIGIGTTWIAGTMDRARFEQAVDLQSGEFMPSISPLGYPAARMSVRESLMRKGVKADSRLPFGELFFDSDFDTPLSPEKAKELQAPLEAVRLAPSAVNKQPWRVVIRDGRAHFYEKRNKARGKEAWDVQRVDLGIALCHFELAAKEAGIPCTFEIDDPGLAQPADTTYIATYKLL